MYFKNCIIVIIFILFSSSVSFAQFEDFEDNSDNEQKSTLREKIFMGGDFGVQLGTLTFLNISPQVGYNITNYWSAGVCSTFMYFRNSYLNYQTSAYGGGVFTELYPFDILVLHGETQMVNIQAFDTFYNPFRTWDLNLLGGGGYRQKIGTKGAINYLILWNFTQSEYSVYSNPVFRISFYF